MLNYISLTIMSAAVVAWLAMLQPADAQERTLGGGLLGAGIGAAVGGGKGAAVGGLIGAGAASRSRSGLSGGLLGAGIGAAFGGKKGAFIGGAAGAGAGLLRKKRRRRK